VIRPLELIAGFEVLASSQQLTAAIEVIEEILVHAFLG
jgi:hypothetical protein